MKPRKHKPRHCTQLPACAYPQARDMASQHHADGHLQATKAIDQLLISIAIFTQQSAKCTAKALHQQTVPSESANALSAQSFVLYRLFESQEDPSGKLIVYGPEQIAAAFLKTLFAFFVYKSIIAAV
nr:hypothetical protein [uncultured Pseudomonas sp.]